jgi:hypothetical protein
MLFMTMLVRYLHGMAKRPDARPVDCYKPGIERALHVRYRPIHVVHEFASRKGNVIVEGEAGKAKYLVEEPGLN